MLCILDKEVKSYRDINFFAKDISQIEFPKNIELAIKRFIKIANDVGLFYPTIKIRNNIVTLKYDQDNRYVIFTILDKKIKYVFGIINCTPKEGEVIELIPQLKAFNDFIYAKVE